MEGSKRIGAEQNPSPELTTISKIVGVYEKWASHTVGRDPRIVKISEAIAGALSTNEALIGAAQEMLDAHQSPQSSVLEDDTRAQHQLRGKAGIIPYPEYAANLLMRGLWHQWRLNSSQTGWPERFISTEVCRQAIENLTVDPAEFAEFQNNIIWRPIQSAVPSRAIGPKIVMAANRERYPKPIKLVSIGHSLGTSEIKLLLNEPFEPVRIMDWHDNQTPILEEKDYLNRYLGDEIAQLKPLAWCSAMDLYPADDDPAAREWALSSFTPREQMNQQFMAEIQRLSSARPDNYVSLHGDFTTRQSADELAASLGGQKADVVLFSTIWYQLSFEDRLSMLNYALGMLDDDGIIILQDHVEVRRLIDDQSLDRVPANHPESTIRQLYFPNEWDQWAYRTAVLDPSRTGMEFQPALYFIDGRCQSVLFSEEYKSKFFGR